MNFLIADFSSRSSRFLFLAGSAIWKCDQASTVYVHKTFFTKIYYCNPIQPPKSCSIRTSFYLLLVGCCIPSLGSALQGLSHGWPALHRVAHSNDLDVLQRLVEDGSLWGCGLRGSWARKTDVVHPGCHKQLPFEDSLYHSFVVMTWGWFRVYHMCEND